MWRKIVLGSVVVAVAGFAVVSYAQFGGGKKGGGMSKKQKQRMQRIRKLQRKVRRSAKAMDSDGDSLYMVKQGQLLKLNSELEQQASKDVGRTLQPAVAASGGKVYLATYEEIMVLDSDLNEVKTVNSDDVGRGKEGASSGMQLPGMGGE